jgi:hypothetical protein
VGDINTYQVFAGLVRQIVDGRGRVGIVVPTGIATDYFNQDYFAALVDNRELVNLYDFENRQGLFAGVHRSYKFSLLTLTGSEAPVAEAEFAFFLHQVSDLADDKRRFGLSSKEVALINPNTGTVPVFRTRRDADLTKRFYRNAPVLINETEDTNPWSISFLRMFGTSKDAYRFEQAEDLRAQGLEMTRNIFSGVDVKYLPLYEGKMFNQFDHRFASVIIDTSRTQRQGVAAPLSLEEHRSPDTLAVPRFWVCEKEVENVLAERQSRQWLVGYKDITSPTNERTLLSSIFPKYAFTDSVLLVIFPDETSSLSISAFLGNLNAFALDYVARQKIGGVHLKYYTFKQLPVLTPNRYTPDLLRFIVPRVLELTYTAWDLQPFANDVWNEAREMGRKGEGERGGTPLQAALLQQWKANQRVVAPAPPPPVTPSPPHTTDFPRPPFTWDAARRSQLRAELDALYAHLYGLSQEELAYILETFPIVKRKDEATYGEYRTKRLVLEAYESPGITETLSY